MVGAKLPSGLLATVGAIFHLLSKPSRFQVDFFVVHVGDHAASFTHHQHACRNVPRGQIALPHAVKAPRCHIGQIEGSRSSAADA